MAQDDDFKNLMEKEFKPSAGATLADTSAPKLTKTDATGQLFQEMFVDKNTGIVNYQNGGHGSLTYKNTTMGFSLREVEGKVHVTLDAIPDGLSRGKLGEYRDTINVLHKALDRPEMSITQADQLSGKSYGHQLPIPDSKVMELSEKLQSNKHEVSQIIRAFASGDDRIVKHTLLAQQAASEAAKGVGKDEFASLLDRPLQLSGNQSTAEVEGAQEFQKLLQGDFGKSQAGHANVKALAATAGVMGLASLGAKAAITHLAPAGIESAMQAERANEIRTLAERNLNNGRLTQAQLDIIQQYTAQHTVAVSATSLVPDPTGLSTDLVANRGDDRLVGKLKEAGLSEDQAKQYQLGSLTGSVQEAGNMIEKHIANLQAVKQEMTEKGQVPLSLALNIPPERLQVLGEYSNHLGDNLIKREISRNSDFESLAHLPADQIGQLSRLAAAGIDPKVQVHHGEISVTSQRPQHLNENPKQAFTEAAMYIFQSGDHQYHAPKNSTIEVQASVAAFGKLYEHLSKDGGVSDQDVKVLAMSMQNITNGFDNHQLQGLVDQYTHAQAPSGT